VNLNPVAVELDLMDPAVTGWEAIDRCRQDGLNEPREGRFDAYSGSLFTLERHNNSIPDTMTN